MAAIKIMGKEYPLPDNYTFAEARLIKRETGLLVGDLGDAFRNGDSDAVLALALIALDRAGDINIDAQNLALGDVVLDFSDETQEATTEDGQSPPEQPAAPDDETGSAA